MKQIMLVIVATLLLSGCVVTAGVRNAVGNVVEGTREANDAAFELSELTHCDGASIGAIKRKFMNNPTKLKLYLDYCGINTEELVSKWNIK